MIDEYCEVKERNRARKISPIIPCDITDPVVAELTKAPLGSEFHTSDTVTSLRRTLQEAQDYKTRLDLLYQVGRKVGSASQMARLVQQITRMTQSALSASASSVLLLDDQKQELIFEVAEGQAGKQLRRIRLNHQAGIAGWVAHHGKPLVINDVSKDERFNKGIDEITGFSTRAIICAPLIVHSKIIGVIEVLNKVDGSDFSSQDLETLVSVASTAAISIENLRLNQTLLDAYKSTIKALAAAIDAKDPYTRGHSEHVTEYALLGANSISFTEEELEDLEYAGILHDVGKIGIADSILNKPGPLTAEEGDIISTHPQIGANMLKDIPFLEKARELILHHHERYDGKGYPDGLKGEAIPMGARLLAVADSFDAMTSDRPYRAALSTAFAIIELKRCSGTQFCPVAVDAFITGFRTKAEASLLTSGLPLADVRTSVRG
jgi:HD-GYP domain-containing protein (c-di-GMP phosphodiesterase class II)